MKWLMPAVVIALTLGGGSGFSSREDSARAAPPTAGAVAALSPEQLARVRVLRDVLAEAGSVTARVALAPDRAGRIAAARTAATRVRELADFAHWAGSSRHVMLMHNLAKALDDYDLEQIALLSDQRADAVTALELQLAPALVSPGYPVRAGGS